MMTKRPTPREDADTAEAALTRLILVLFRTHGAVLASGEALVAPLGLTSTRWQVLGALALAGSPTTVPSIAAAMGLTRQAVQKQVDLMNSDGLVELRENPAHKRSVLVALTKPGAQLYNRAARRQQGWARDLATGFAVEDLAVAASVLERMRVRLSSDNAAD